MEQRYLLQLPGTRLPHWPVGELKTWKHCRWIFTKQNMFSIRALLTEAASTGAASHWSPAVQHWSLCVFWCTGPECDVISLLRQKRQARSPPSGHRPLSWTAALYVIITERHRQAELSCLWKVLIEQGETLASGARTGTRIGGRKDAREARTGQTGTSAALKTCQPQWTRTTTNLASSLSFSESRCAADRCSVLTPVRCDYSQPRDEFRV